MAKDSIESKIKNGTLENKSQRIKDIWINENLTYKQQVYFAKKYSKMSADCRNASVNWKFLEFQAIFVKLPQILQNYRKIGV